MKRNTNISVMDLRDGGRTTKDNLDLMGLSKVELVDLLYETDKELRNTNPLINYHKWVVLQERFNSIVETYYSNYWDGAISLEN